MNIVVIEHYAGSPWHGMGVRCFYLSREWRRAGHSVHMVAASFTHLRQRQPEMKALALAEEIDGLSYLWLRTPAYRGNGAGRALNLLAFAGQLFWQQPVLQSLEPDVVVVSSPHPLAILGGYRLARKTGAALIFEVRDLWPISLTEVGRISKANPLIALMQWAEDFAYRKADRVVSLLPLAEPYMKQHGLADGKFRYIPNGVLIREWEESTRSSLPPEHEAFLQRLQQSGEFGICYAGAHGEAQGLETLLQAAAELTDVPVHFVLVGHGPEKAKLQALAESMQLRRITFLPSLAKKQVPRFLSAMDALYIGLRAQPVFRFGISPNKLMEYMMTGKPTLCAVKAGNDPVGECDGGITVPPDNPAALVSAVRRLIRLPESERRAMGSRAQAYVHAHHDFEKLAQSYLQLMNSL